MKLVYNEGEKESLREIHKDSMVRIFEESNPDRVYSLNFKVTDPAIAQYVLHSMLNNKIDIDLGIDIQSINFYEAFSTQGIKEKLHRMIEEIIL